MSSSLLLKQSSIPLGEPIHTHDCSNAWVSLTPTTIYFNLYVLLTPGPVQLLKQFLHVDGNRHVKDY